MFAYPTFEPNSEVGYQIGVFPQFVPPFLADCVLIRPFGEYGLATYPISTSANYSGGAYVVNGQSDALDQNTGITDLVYLVENDLKLLSGVKKVILAFYWYSSLDADSPAYKLIQPAVGLEVQAWNWHQGPPAEYQAGLYNRGTACRLQSTHQIWPTPDDNALLDGIKYLQVQGYEVGLCPLIGLISKNFYFANGGETEADRAYQNWTNISAFSNFLNAYQVFYQHYIDLLTQHNIRPWIIYLGSGMRDITGNQNKSYLVPFVQLLQKLAAYAKTQLPNTLLTYAADLDEYYYSYPANFNYGYLDPLWSCPDIDFVGINWFAPLALNDTEDNLALQKGVTQGEGDNFFLTNFDWRTSHTDRYIDSTTMNFKTGLAQSPLTYSIKNIIDWLSFYHYYPTINGVLAGCSPLAGFFPGDVRLCSHIHGTGIVQSNLTFNPQLGGIAPVPKTLPDAWVLVQAHSYMTLNFPAVIPDNSVMEFAFQFEIDPQLTDLTGNYRLFQTEFGLALDSLNGTITLWLPGSDGSFQSVPLFSANKGDIVLNYTATKVDITVNGAYDLSVAAQTLFNLPEPTLRMWLGNPQIAKVLPSGYGVWQGRISYLGIVLGVDSTQQSGGRFYFEDSYNGIRTAWIPNLKPWMATAFGYGSVSGSAADPQTRAKTYIAPLPTKVPNWYEDYPDIVSGYFQNRWQVVNIEGPYGSDFASDDIYQAIVLHAAALGIIFTGAVHLAAWFLDTRSAAAYRALFSSHNIFLFNDAFDYPISSALNGKAAVRYGGANLWDQAFTTIDEDLGLSIVSGPLPPEKIILVQALASKL